MARTDSCDHSLSIFGTMETTEITHEYIQRRCRRCDYKDTLKRAGRVHRGYSVAAESKRDFERREYAKDLLQPQEYNKNEKKFETSKLFKDAWGEPEKKADVGSAVEKLRIKE